MLSKTARNWRVIAGYLICILTITYSDQHVKIGVLFSGSRSSEAVRQVVEMAVETIRVTRPLPSDVTLQILYNVTHNRVSAFENIQSVCHLVEQGVSIIIGPGFSDVMKATHPISEGMHIPQISPSAADPELFIESNDYQYMFKMNYPFNVQSRVVSDLIRHFGWQRMAVLLQYSTEGRHWFAEFQRLAVHNNWSVAAAEFIFHLSNISALDARQQLVNIRNKGVRIVILACDVSYAKKIFEQAFLLEMVRPGWVWLFTDSDTSVNDFYDTCTDPPLHLRGIIAVRTAYGRGELYANFTDQLHGSSSARKLDSVLMRTYDSVLVALYGLSDFFSAGHNLTQVAMTPGVCSSRPSTPRTDGRLLSQYILNASGPGAMRYLNFSKLRNPPSYEYEIVNLQAAGWVQVGDWSDRRPVPLHVTGSVKFPGETQNVPSDTASELRNLTLEVVTILEEPFAMYRMESELHYKPNVRLKGYCIDLLNTLQQALGFSYHIHIVRDKMYGARDERTNQWNGIVGEIIRGEADVAVAPLTITYERQQNVDFTKPFFDLGLAILMAKEAPSSNLLAFLEPFHWNLWITVIASFFVCGIAGTLCSYISPFGYYGRYSQRLDPENKTHKEQRKALNICDNLWYTYASWQQQGPEVTSRCLSGRIVHGIWWFFVTLITATYTANLTAFLTVERMESGIHSIVDLADQTEIAYGTVVNSAPADFFIYQKGRPYRRMYDYMTAEDTWVPNASAGISKVRASYGIPKGREGHYAFIFDSTALEYAAANKPCNVRVVGKMFNRFGYGLAFRKNSPFKEIFSLEILRLRQSGELGTLYSKWFTGTCDVTSAGSRSSSIATSQVSLASMTGVFAFLAMGIVVGLSVIFCEICAASYSDAKRNKHQSWRQSLGCMVARLKTDIMKHLLRTSLQSGAQDFPKDSRARPCAERQLHTNAPPVGGCTKVTEQTDDTILEYTKL